MVTPRTTQTDNKVDEVKKERKKQRDTWPSLHLPPLPVALVQYCVQNPLRLYLMRILILTRMSGSCYCWNESVDDAILNKKTILVEKNVDSSRDYRRRLRHLGTLMNLGHLQGKVKLKWPLGVFRQLISCNLVCSVRVSARVSNSLSSFPNLSSCGVPREEQHLLITATCDRGWV